MNTEERPWETQGEVALCRPRREATENKCPWFKPPSVYIELWHPKQADIGSIKE